MKKLLSTALIAVIISSTVVDTINAAIERRKSARTARRQAPRKRRIIARKKRILPIPTGKTSPEQLKKTAMQSDRDAKKLQQDAKKSETEKVAEKTVVAEAKKAEININKIEQQLANLRTWSGDVLPGGYSLEEKNKAFEIAAPLIRESEALKQQVKEIQKKINNITTKTYLGFGTPTVNPGKEKEYNIYNGIIKAAEKRLAQLEPAIAQQEIIMGKRRSNAIKTAYASMAVAALAIGDYVSGGMISGAAVSTVTAIANNVAYYIKTPASAIWSYFRGVAPQAIVELTTEQFEDANNFNRSIETGLEKLPADASDKDKYETIKQIVSRSPRLQRFGAATIAVITDTLFEIWKGGVKIGTKWAANSVVAQFTSLLGSSKEYSKEDLMKKNDAVKTTLKAKEKIEKK